MRYVSEERCVRISNLLVCATRDATSESMVSNLETPQNEPISIRMETGSDVFRPPKSARASCRGYGN
jgi:hypothetical protein